MISASASEMASPPDTDRVSVISPTECEPPDASQLSRHLHSRWKRSSEAAPPIFIHSSWRASHTWFWMKFREHPSTLCFYEPFHECLATLTRSEAASLGPNSWHSRHPAGEPYYREFLPLIRKAGGVRLFIPEIPYRWFLPVGGPTGDLHSEERKYLALLIRHAERLRRTPVFGFTRSLGRLAAIKRQFPGIHIFQYRNLWTQWVSLVDQRQKGNKYFLHLLEVIPEHDLFSLYMAFHIYLYMLAYNCADIVVDVTKLAKDKNYRHQVCSQLVSATDLPITLDEAHELQQHYPFDPSLINWEEIRENVNFAVRMLDHVFDRQELLRYGAELVNETLGEIEIAEKYVSRTRCEIARLTGERDSLSAARSALAAELDRVIDERDVALTERDRLSQQRAAAMAEADRLADELAAARAKRETLLMENARLESELAAAVSALKAAQSALAALRTELSHVAADREQLVTESEEWFNAAVAWAADRLLGASRLGQGQWVHRLMLRLRAGVMAWCVDHVNHKASPRIRANRARDAGEWELAARFYVDQLDRNVYDPAIWVQLGRVLEKAGRASAAEIAYLKAAALSGKSTKSASLPARLASR
jgi:hypothetical protein